MQRLNIQRLTKRKYEIPQNRLINCSDYFFQLYLGTCARTILFYFDRHITTSLTVNIVKHLAHAFRFSSLELFLESSKIEDFSRSLPQCCSVRSHTTCLHLHDLALGKVPLNHWLSLCT